MIAFLLAIRKIFSAIVAGIGKAIAYLIAHPKVLAIVVVVGLALFGAYKAKSYLDGLHDQITSLTTTNKSLQAKNDQLLIDIKTAKDANDNNQRIIDNFKATSEVVATVMKNLNTNVEKNKQNLTNLQSRLDKYGAIDNGPVSKVLRDAIIGIQNDRTLRATEQPK